MSAGALGLDVAVDVAVLGGGNAGLCAALAARQRGATVVVVEGAPKEFRGGNSRHTRNLRSMHDAPTEAADRRVLAKTSSSPT